MTWLIHGQIFILKTVTFIKLVESKLKILKCSLRLTRKWCTFSQTLIIDVNRCHTLAFKQIKGVTLKWILRNLFKFMQIVRKSYLLRKCIRINEAMFNVEGWRFAVACSKCNAVLHYVSHKSSALKSPSSFVSESHRRRATDIWTNAPPSPDSYSYQLFTCTVCIELYVRLIHNL